MGIPKSSFLLLVEEAKKGSFKGKKILQLGRQHTFLTFSHAVELAKKSGFKFTQIDPNKINFSFSSDLAALGYIDDITLFMMLGFDEVHSLDVSPYEKATYVHDLNHPIPPELHQRYDVIFDGGTMEHIFSPPQVLANIHNLLKTGGMIIHASPSHNYVDHGFYMFSPTFFYEYYVTNSYHVVSSYIFESSFENNTSWHVYNYQPGWLESLSFGGFGKKMLGIWFVAQKQASSTEGKIPQQGAYFNQWTKQPTFKTLKTSSFKSWLKKIRLLHFIVLRSRKKYNQYKTKKFLSQKKIGVF